APLAESLAEVGGNLRDVWVPGRVGNAPDAGGTAEQKRPLFAVHTCPNPLDNVIDHTTNDNELVENICYHRIRPSAEASLPHARPPPGGEGVRCVLLQGVVERGRVVVDRLPGVVVFGRGRLGGAVAGVLSRGPLGGCGRGALGGEP